MSVEDGNTQPATVDPNQIAGQAAEMLYNKLLEERQAEAARNRSAASPSDPAAALIQDLQAQGYKKEFIDAMVVAQVRQQQAFDARLNEVQSVNEVRENNRAIDKIASRYIRDIIKDEPRFKSIQGQIRQDFVKAVQNSKERQAEMRSGEINEDAYEEMLGSIADNLSKDLGWEKSATNAVLPGKSNQSTPKNQANPNADTNTSADLTEHQEAFRDARMETLMRYAGKSKEDALKEATELARTMPAPSLKNR